MGSSTRANPTADSTIQRVGYKSQVSGTKIHKKGKEKSGLVLPPRQDVILPSLSGSRCRLTWGHDVFYTTKWETTRTNLTGLEKCTESQ